MLERMGEFFDARLEVYDAHMLNEIESAREFYPYTASLLPREDGASVLDLGCGTGLELEYYFELSPNAKITGIDLAEGMLGALRAKFPDKDIELIRSSYFDEPFGEERYSAAVSVESLHHFTKEEKIPLYAKLKRALKDGGFFILTDYFAGSDDEERLYRRELETLKGSEGITDGEFYHYDTPLTVDNESDALIKAGFSRVEHLRAWGNTHTLKAYK